MKYGYFDDGQKEYVITRPDTPYPWINYLGMDEFFGLISNTAGGYSFYKDARLRRITRYRHNNIPVDSGGRYFYINDDGLIWSPTWQPVRTPLDHYECRHGLGYTKITGEKNKIRAEVLYFVPVQKNCEIHRVRLSNHGSEARKIKLFSFVEFCLWNAFDDMTNFQRNFNTGEVEVEEGVIYHKTEYRERRDHYAFYGVNQKVSGFDTDRETFFGLYNGWHEPQVVIEGQARNSLAEGWSPVASHFIEVPLEAGESKELIFVLGYIENPEEEKWEKPGIINKKPALELMEELFQSAQVAERFAELRRYWDDILSVFSIKSNDERLDRMVKIWNPYQNMVTFNLSRGPSYFESGISRGIGFRDSNQDILGFVSLAPGKARARILDLAATQFPDGGAYHQYQPLTRKGNSEIGDGFNDDPLWLIYSVIGYIKETGDYSILSEEAPFDNNPALAENLMEHLRRSLRYTINNLGPHGLPLIGRADWNDCLNLNCYSKNPDESFQTCSSKEGKTAESVMIATLFLDIAPEYARLCRILGLDSEADEVMREVAGMREAVMKHGFDGDWFLRAYDDQGRKVGSKENDEGQIFIEPQGFAIMAGLGVEDGLALRVLDSVKSRLDTEYGIKLLAPAYTGYRVELGEITSYPPGYKENAGIFCHSNPWIMIAETIMGRSEEAFKYYAKIAPAYGEERSERHRTEPYVYAQMIAGNDNNRHGEAKNSWLTGTAAWNYVAVTQYILGIRPDFDGLIIDPCLPASIDEIRIQRIFRGVKYNILIKNKRSGEYRLTVQGEEIDGKTIIPSLSRDVVDVYCEV